LLEHGTQLRLLGLGVDLGQRAQQAHVRQVGDRRVGVE
jgi:hypothetical protein